MNKITQLNSRFSVYLILMKVKNLHNLQKVISGGKKVVVPKNHTN